MTKVIIRQRYRTRIEHNPTSGHSWPVDEPLQQWEVVGSLGVDSTHRTEARAQHGAAVLQAFYDKFDL